MATTIALDKLNDPQSPAKLPVLPVDSNNYAGILASGISMAQPQEDPMKWAKAYISGSTPPPSTADAYEEAYGSAGIDEKQKTVNDLTAQLNAIAAENKVAELKMKDSGASLGEIQGRNIANERDAAIRSLPIQAALSAAQGNLSMATDKLNTLFKLKSDDAQRKYDYDRELRKSVYDIADKEQQRKLDEIQRKDDQAFQIKMQNLKFEQDKALKVFDKKNNGLFDGFLDETDVKKIDVSPQGKSVKALGTLKQKIQTYRDLVDKYGTSSFGKQKAQLESAYADLKIAYKEAANLGALTGPDVSILEEAIKPATNAWFGTQAWRNITGNGKGTILSSLDTALNSVNKNAVNNIQQLYARDPRYASSFYVQEITNPFKDEITLSDDQIKEMTSNLSPEQLQQLKDDGLIPK